MNDLLSRITTNPNVCKGKPSIRNMRFTVNQMLELLASGMSFSEILKDYPYIDQDDINACLAFAAQITNSNSIIDTISYA